MTLLFINHVWIAFLPRCSRKSSRSRQLWNEEVLVDLWCKSYDLISGIVGEMRRLFRLTTTDARALNFHLRFEYLPLRRRYKNA